MSARDDRLAAESESAKVRRAVAEARREWDKAHPDPSRSPEARSRALSDAMGMDSPLRRPMTREEQDRSRSPGGKS